MQSSRDPPADTDTEIHDISLRHLKIACVSQRSAARARDRAFYPHCQQEAANATFQLRHGVCSGARQTHNYAGQVNRDWADQKSAHLAGAGRPAAAGDLSRMASHGKASRLAFRSTTGCWRCLEALFLAVKDDTALRVTGLHCTCTSPILFDACNRESLITQDGTLPNDILPRGNLMPLPRSVHSSSVQTVATCNSCRFTLWPA